MESFWASYASREETDDEDDDMILDVICLRPVLKSVDEGG